MLTRVLFALGVSAAAAALLVPGEALADSRGRSHTVDRRFEKKPRPSRAVPEINAQHAGTAAALVAGGIAVALGRRRRRENA